MEVGKDLAARMQDQHEHIAATLADAESLVRVWESVPGAEPGRDPAGTAASRTA